MMLDVDDDDLGLSIEVVERQPGFLSDVALSLAKINVGLFQVNALKMFQQKGLSDYSVILEVDAIIRKQLNWVDGLMVSSNPRRFPCKCFQMSTDLIYI